MYNFLINFFFFDFFLFPFICETMRFEAVKLNNVMLKTFSLWNLSQVLVYIREIMRAKMADFVKKRKTRAHAS